jgi:hypothetical protein
MPMTATMIEPIAPLVQAGLLAGLGAQAAAVADELAGLAPGDPSARTCVDDGGPLVLGVGAPGPRALHLEARAATTPGAVYWHGLRAAAGRPWRRWRTVTFVGEPAGAWPEVLDWAHDAGREPALRAAHAALGGRARLFTVSDDPWLDELWAGWRLDGSYPPSQALRDAGHGQAWPAAFGLLRRLVGPALSERSHPWGLLLPLHQQAQRVRVATTVWSRVPEDATKHRRLAEAIDQLGGDGAFAEALYELLIPGPSQPHGVGRALIVELDGAEPVGLQALLRADRGLPVAARRP